MVGLCCQVEALVNVQAGLAGVVELLRLVPVLLLVGDGDEPFEWTPQCQRFSLCRGTLSGCEMCFALSCNVAELLGKYLVVKDVVDRLLDVCACRLADVFGGIRRRTALVCEISTRHSHCI